MAAAGIVGNGTSGSVRNVRPPIVIPTPSMWDHILPKISFDDQIPEKYAQDIEALKAKAKSKLMAAKSTDLFILVDTLEHLGLAYHFESEIKDKLSQVYDCDDYNLFAASLRFRLLRQYQIRVSSDDVFKKFVDGDGKLKESLSNDVEGLLSLYEAAHTRIHNEHILEEAMSFTTHHLNRMLPELQSPLKDKVQRALEHSFHRGILIFNLPFYISTYEKEDSRDELLLKLAKLNFKILQNMYREELIQLSSRWNKFDLKSKLPYIRDRLVECYFWGLAFRFEPQYSYVRTEVALSTMMASVIDDTYDNYATLDEAELFTQILERWNLDEIDVLPEYMKVVYKFVMSVYQDFERAAIQQQKTFAIPFYREAVKQLARAYNQEQIWIMERQMPSFKEYITNSVITSSVYVMFGSSIPGIKSATIQTVEWLSSEPKIVISAAKMGRHLQDLASHDRESREGKLLTVVDCYMKDRGVSQQEALSEFERLVQNGWKDMNNEWANGSSGPKEMVEQLMNYGRAAEVTYKYAQDHFTYPEKFLGPKIAALLLDPLI